MVKTRGDRTPLLLEVVEELTSGPSRPALRVVAVPGAADIGRLIPIRTRSTTLGRDANRAGPGYVALPDPTLSREHISVVVEASGTITLKDLGSTNGTRLNAERVEGGRVRCGDVIRIANTVLLVCDEPVIPADDLGMVGHTPEMAALRQTIQRAAPSTLPVLVIGETGTGKELVAGAVHRASKRPGRLVTINCAAIPENLVESTLFGHQRGAFTGATTTEPGAFVDADGGTLFLDEIGEMSPMVQPKLLRVLEAGEVTPVGSSRARKVDVRLVAATNRELREEVAESRFREDLYARIAGVTVRPPPLRDRRDDLAALFSRFLPGTFRGVPVLHPDATVWTLPMLGDELQETHQAYSPPAWPPSREDLERLLAHFDGNVSEAARAVNRNRKQIYRWMDKLGIQQSHKA
jgi:hypothetical protein